MFFLNWRDESAYHHTATHHDKLWAWEFLRRNPEYQKDWDASLLYESMRKSRSGAQILTQHSSSPSKKPALSLEEAIQKWGIPIYIDPANNDPPFLLSEFDPWIIMGDKHPLSGKLGVPNIMGECDLAAQFNLYLPLEPQIERVRKYLLTLQKRPEIKKHVRRFTKHKRVWKTYLRVLDAHNIGVKRSIATPLLFPNDTNVYEHWDETLKQAKSMSRIGYRALL